jgi:hypothetical protein
MANLEQLVKDVEALGISINQIQIPRRLEEEILKKTFELAIKQNRQNKSKNKAK